MATLATHIRQSVARWLPGSLTPGASDVKITRRTYYMRLIARRIVPGVGVIAVLALARIAGVIAVSAQAPATVKAPLAEEVFTNVRVLRGIPVDEFMGTMGFFSASLGMSCEDCHGASDTTWENYARDVSPKKATARRMIQMMTSINQTSFGGRAVVTCYTCHRGGARPKVTPSLALLYGATMPDEVDDVVVAAKDAPPVDQILGKYIQAIGGQQRIAGMTSVVGRGSSAGYGPEGTRPIEIVAKAPNQRTMILHTLDGDSTTTYDGRVGWSAVPHKPVPVLALAGSELDGVRLDAEMMFPARIKDALTGWRVGSPGEIDGKPVQVVQGSRPGGVLATFYFDSESGLLTRLVRYANSRVGRLPTQVDYADYRDVSGVRIPFHLKITWLDGQEDVTLTDVQLNVPVEAARFAKPLAPAPPK
jgi:photosynthetic reaction center cytochrome c subunit